MMSLAIKNGAVVGVATQPGVCLIQFRRAELKDTPTNRSVVIFPRTIECKF